jgi:hypothetical protein
VPVLGSALRAREGSGQRLRRGTGLGRRSGLVVSGGRTSGFAQHAVTSSSNGRPRQATLSAPARFERERRLVGVRRDTVYIGDADILAAAYRRSRPASRHGNTIDLSVGEPPLGVGLLLEFAGADLIRASLSPDRASSPAEIKRDISASQAPERSCKSSSVMRTEPSRGCRRGRRSLCRVAHRTAS